MRKKYPMRSSQIIAPFLFLACAFFLFYALVFAQSTQAQRSEIYSRIECCNCEVSFEQCACMEAKEIKAYVDALIETGIAREEIFYRLAKKFSLSIIVDQRIKSEIGQRLINEAGEKHPQIVLMPPSFNFGAVSKKQKSVTKLFKLSNKGNDTLIIKNIKTSCPCALAALKTDQGKTPYYGMAGSPADWKVEVKPQQGAELEVLIDLTSPHIKSGKVFRNVTIISNDPLYPETTVTVEAMVNS